MLNIKKSSGTGKICFAYIQNFQGTENTRGKLSMMISCLASNDARKLGYWIYVTKKNSENCFDNWSNIWLQLIVKIEYM